MKTVIRFMKLAYLSLAAMIFVFSLSAFAAVPGTPVDFKATILQDQKGNDFVRLEWKRDVNGGLPQYFYIFKAIGRETDLNKFSKITKVSIVSKDTGKTYEIDYKYDVTGLQTGEYSFYITAINSEGSSQPTQIETMSIRQSSQIYFTTTPSKYGIVGKEYVYDADAKSSVSGEIRFIGINPPQGAAVDSATGVFRYTSSVEGKVSFSMKAYLASDPTLYAVQQWYVIFGKDSSGTSIYFTTTASKYGIVGKEYLYDADAKSSVSGEIRFIGINLPQGATVDSTTGVFRYTTSVEGKVSFSMKAYLASDPTINAIQQWYVIFSKDSNITPTTCAIIRGNIIDKDTTLMRSGYVKAIAVDSIGQNAVSQISGGGYYLKLKEGTYVLYITGPEFVSEWYQDASSIQTAQRLTIKCTDSLYINMIVERVTMKSISGQVIAEDDGSPQMATITFKSKDGAYKFSTVTDQTGKYQMSLPANAEYIVSATPKNYLYYPQHYNKASDIALATLVLLDADKTGIDFALVKKPSYSNGIKGSVIDSAGSGIPAYVTAYMIDQSGKPNKNYSFTAATDSLGVFDLKSLQPGTYILYAQPMKKDFVAGYYKENSYAMLSWDQATQITVTSNGIITGCIIKLSKRSGIKGVAILQGSVIGNSLGIMPGGEQPIAGACVLIRDQSGQISDYGFTDLSGKYLLNEAAAGNFTMLVEKIGYSTTSIPVSFNYTDKLIVEVSVVLQPKSATSVGDQSATVNDFTLSAYPNPVTSIINFRIDDVTENLTVKIYTALGVTVYSSKIQSVQSMNEFTFSTSHLPVGMYYFQVDGLRSSRTLSFVVVK